MECLFLRIPRKTTALIEFQFANDLKESMRQFLMFALVLVQFFNRVIFVFTFGLDDKLFNFLLTEGV